MSLRLTKPGVRNMIDEVLSTSVKQKGPDTEDRDRKAYFEGCNSGVRKLTLKV